MKPILLIHGYSSEGKDTKVEDIYGTLPEQLRQEFGGEQVKELNLSRWISLSDGVRIDDVSFAMDRALKARFPALLRSGFHVVIHSTGALVVRNWIKNHAEKPCPIDNLVHLAGANFGSGLAHIGQGELSRWGRLIFQHTGRGQQVLQELEFGSWKTLDLHGHFLQENCDIYTDYQVQEFCIIGSQIPAPLRFVPIRYLKEDSSDNTVRTSAGNLNFNYLPVTPKAEAFSLPVASLKDLIERRLENQSIKENNYEFNLDYLSHKRPQVPFAVAYETAHFGAKKGIVSGSQNRRSVMPLIKTALQTPYDSTQYELTATEFRKATDETFKKASELKWALSEWNKQAQYEGHAQLIFRIRDQFGVGVKYYDITIKSRPTEKNPQKLESLIEDRHNNSKDDGTATFYLRTQHYDKKSETWRDLIPDLAPVHVEVTGHETRSGEIAYVPLNIRLTANQISAILSTFQTTIIDIEMVRLPSQKVFAIKSA